MSCNGCELQPGTDKTSPGRVSFRERLRHMTWALFTLCLSIGGIELLLAFTPNKFSGIGILGTIVFILGLVLFLIITIGMILRFTFSPVALAASISHPTESMFSILILQEQILSACEVT